jgi:myo-inositol catabolism protein IolC
MFAGMITFSAFEEDGATVAQIQVLIRANDPLIEVVFRLGLGHPVEDAFWRDTLLNVADRLGVKGQVVQQNVLVDPRLQWKEAGNIWHNAGIRSGLYAPVALVRRVLGK